VANVRAILARRDLRGAGGEARLLAAYTLLVARDEAEYLWGALLHLGRRYGLAAVGMHAVETGTT
jgi:hypothetical protein